jgi:hypothetical protein
MKFIEYDSNTLEKMDKIISKNLAKTISIQKNINPESLQILLNIKSVNTVFQQNFTNTIISHGLNKEIEFPRLTLQQRNMDKNVNDYNTYQVLHETLGRNDLKIMNKTNDTTPIIAFNPEEYNVHNHNVIYNDYSDTEWILAESDVLLKMVKLQLQSLFVIILIKLR